MAARYGSAVVFTEKIRVPASAFFCPLPSLKHMTIYCRSPHRPVMIRLAEVPLPAQPAIFRWREPLQTNLDNLDRFDHSREWELIQWSSRKKPLERWPSG